MPTTNVNISELIQLIGNDRRYIDVCLNRDKLFKKIDVSELVEKHGSLLNFFNDLKQQYQVETLYVDVFKPNGSSYLLLQNYLLTLNENKTTESTSMQNKDHSPIVTAEPQSVSVYQFQNQFIHNQFTALQKDYTNLKEKFDTISDENRNLKTELSVANMKKDMEVLAANNNAMGALGHVKEMATPENIKMVFEGIGTLLGKSGGKSDEESSFLKGLDVLRKDGLSAIADIMKETSDDEVSALTWFLIMVSKAENKDTYFQDLKTKIQQEIK